MILERMTEALRDLEKRWRGRRTPKAFYLGPDDWTDFLATDPPSIETTFNREPAVEPGFENVPVRASRNVPARQSRLYDSTTTGYLLPRTPKYPRRKLPAPPERADISPAEVEAALDAISRTRALTDSESDALEAAIKGRVILTKRDAARLGIKRRPPK